MYTLKVRSHQREELIEFTAEVQSKLKESGARDGVVVLYVQHTTAGLTVNENADPDVPRDMLHALRTLIPNTAWISTMGKRIPTRISKPVW